jgi:branched-chain amino acid transport system permease protein
VHLTKYRLLSFAVSGGIAALAGAVYVTWFGIAQSEQFPTGISLVLVAMVMIGGLGSLSGGILGSFLVIGLPELLDFANDWVVSIGTGILLLVVIVRAPGGLAGLIALIKRAVVEAIDDLSKQTPAPAPPPEPARTQ